MQRELPYKLVFDIGYVGNASRHQMYVQQLEQLPLGLHHKHEYSLHGQQRVGGDSALQRLQLHPLQRFGATSAYNGLQVKVSRRFSNKLTINADYTWSKAIDLEDIDNEQNVIPGLHPTQASSTLLPASTAGTSSTSNMSTTFPNSRAPTSWCSSPPAAGSIQGLRSSGAEAPA